MSAQPGEEPAATFAATAPYYARYRPPYPDDFYTLLADRFRLDGTQAALDLGSGPGTIALPLARMAGHVYAVDPAVAMLDEGRRLAHEHAITNVTWLEGTSGDITRLGLPPLDVCTMGKSFHWTDRGRALADLDTLIAPGGGLTLISSVTRPDSHRPAWLDVIGDVCARFLGPDYRQTYGPAGHPALGRDDDLAQSAFSQIETVEWDQHLVYTLDELVGLQFSFSYCNPGLLGDRCAAFEDALRASLTEFAPNCRYETTIQVEAAIATRP